MHEKMGVDGKEDFVFVKLCVHVDRNTNVHQFSARYMIVVFTMLF